MKTKLHYRRLGDWCCGVSIGAFIISLMGNGWFFHALAVLFPLGQIGMLVCGERMQKITSHRWNRQMERGRKGKRRIA